MRLFHFCVDNIKRLTCAPRRVIFSHVVPYTQKKKKERKYLMLVDYSLSLFSLL